MARSLDDEPCEVTFFDRISDSKMTLYYRMPETEERVAYTNSLATRRGNKVESNVGATRSKYGAAILTGFKDGAFARKKVPISCDPTSPNYDPAWKTVVRQRASDVIEALAIHVFESSLLADVEDALDEAERKTEDPL